LIINWEASNYFGLTHLLNYCFRWWCRFRQWWCLDSNDLCPNTVGGKPNNGCPFLGFNWYCMILLLERWWCQWNGTRDPNDEFIGFLILDHIRSICLYNFRCIAIRHTFPSGTILGWIKF
jgi:hypothetical protein